MEEEVKCGSVMEVVAGRNSIVEVAVVEETAYTTPLPSFFNTKILQFQMSLFFTKILTSRINASFSFQQYSSTQQNLTISL